MNKEKVIIIILLLLLVWFGSAIVRLENYHYAVQVGMCNEYGGDILQRFNEREDCINKTKTRTSFVWQLFYGLKILD
jgi:hypothetical protein